MLTHWQECWRDCHSTEARSRSGCFNCETDSLEHRRINAMSKPHFRVQSVSTLCVSSTSRLSDLSKLNQGWIMKFSCKVGTNQRCTIGKCHFLSPLPPTVNIFHTFLLRNNIFHASGFLAGALPFDLLGYVVVTQLLISAFKRSKIAFF